MKKNETLLLKFRVFHESYDGPISIAGDIKELGAWEKPIKLFYVDSESPNWESSFIEAKNAKIIEFKALLGKRNAKFDWEKVPNRIINLSEYNKENICLLISFSFNNEQISLSPQKYTSSKF